ncbi:MAG: flagellar hook-associated protein FlgK [Desulfovibrio sp.]|nr:flagellar hook-associated protein FlgK [Desulfovibrio sp.]
MLNGLFNIGQSALNASQAWISVTGNNLANVDTEGYSRQYVDQKDAGGLTYKPGAQPLGVNAQQIMRFFDQFLERSYVKQSTNSSRWDQQDTIMASLENIFNESNRQGINSSLNSFFNAWQDLALRPDSTANRESLISFSDSLADMFSTSMDAIKSIQTDMNVSIAHDVKRVNELSQTIAELNRQITAQTIDGMNNPNALLDKRDQAVRELATLVDVETIDHGKGNFRVQLSTGQPLVDGTETYELAVLGPRSENRLMPDSTYEGTVTFEGKDTHEYTIEIVRGGNAGDVPPPQFKVSVGGVYLKDAHGNDTFDITVGEDGKTAPVKIKELEISFTSDKNFNAGDKFDVVPKDGLYWIEPTRGPQNITPQINLNGQENKDRVTGGKLAAYHNIRDDNCGRYKDELNAVASSLIWEVNRIHSQGAGLSKLTQSQGQQRVGDTTKPLGTAQAMMPNSDRLKKGTVNFHFYNKEQTDGNNYIGSVSFDFDPATDSLETVVENINTQMSPNFLTASIQDNKLVLVAKDGVEFAMGTDTSGVMAALGINTFFTGSNASDIAVNDMVHLDTNFIAAGAVNGQFQVNVGDNITATAIGKLVDKPVTISTMWKTVNNQTIGQFYANLVTTVGSDRRLSKTNTEYHTALTNDLFDRTQAVTGVNMDEEMSNLIKFQHSYTAAAKMITTADQMLQTLLGLKQ